MSEKYFWHFTVIYRHTSKFFLIFFLSFFIGKNSGFLTFPGIFIYKTLSLNFKNDVKILEILEKFWNFSVLFFKEPYKNLTGRGVKNRTRHKFWTAPEQFLIFASLKIELV